MIHNNIPGLCCCACGRGRTVRLFPSDIWDSSSLFCRGVKQEDLSKVRFLARFGGVVLGGGLGREGNEVAVVVDAMILDECGYE